MGLKNTSMDAAGAKVRFTRPTQPPSVAYIKPAKLPTLTIDVRTTLPLHYSIVTLSKEEWDRLLPAYLEDFDWPREILTLGELEPGNYKGLVVYQQLPDGLAMLGWMCYVPRIDALEVIKLQSISRVLELFYPALQSLSGLDREIRLLEGWKPTLEYRRQPRIGEFWSQEFLRNLPFEGHSDFADVKLRPYVGVWSSASLFKDPDFEPTPYREPVGTVLYAIVEDKWLGFASVVVSETSVLVTAVHAVINQFYRADYIQDYLFRLVFLQALSKGYTEMTFKSDNVEEAIWWQRNLPEGLGYARSYADLKIGLPPALAEQILASTPVPRRRGEVEVYRQAVFDPKSLFLRGSLNDVKTRKAKRKGQIVDVPLELPFTEYSAPGPQDGVYLLCGRHGSSFKWPELPMNGNMQLLFINQHRQWWDGLLPMERKAIRTYMKEPALSAQLSVTKLLKTAPELPENLDVWMLGVIVRFIESKGWRCSTKFEDSGLPTLRLKLPKGMRAGFLLGAVRDVGFLIPNGLILRQVAEYKRENTRVGEYVPLQDSTAFIQSLA